MKIDIEEILFCIIAIPLLLIFGILDLILFIIPIDKLIPDSPRSEAMKYYKEEEEYDI